MPQTTFFCDKNDFDESALKIFTINTGARVVIRGYAVIEDGYMRPIEKTETVKH